MNYGVVVTGKTVQQEQLFDFIVTVQQLTGAEISIEPQWLLRSDDTAVMGALSSLFGEPEPKKAKEEPKKAEPTAEVKRKRSDFAFPVKDGAEVKVWEIHVPGISGKTLDPLEKLTITEKNVRLAAGKFATGTLMRHPKAGWSQVTGEFGSGQGMQDIPASEAIKILDQV